MTSINKLQSINAHRCIQLVIQFMILIAYVRTYVLRAIIPNRN
jgi:hypothetical protein